ncbi:error-prone DNA polymerase [Pollutimonas harenae]|uniref:Error-prone DNA polymerase n=1 Tax=Pollutimonas harenae TaxID=657015 RepID=A0A853GS57_9BURK|nr:error-prone DNA polymerase [Pollutimonas harenae]NYT85938.1 error-prone DNA polymerase [Pollutimonas harenae]TEA71538.1 error-prone DNA polymerase [Pollutimonas harenae]
MHALTPPPYAELDCISNFSFLQGASHPEELIERAAHLGYEALALSDECSLAGVVRAWTEAKKHRVKLIIGSRFVLDGMHIIVLARNLNGYGNLAELITLARRSCAKGQYQLSLQNILAPAPGHEHLKRMPDCLFIFKPDYGADLAQLKTQIPLLQQAFPGRLWLGLSLHHRYTDAQHLITLQSAAERFDLKLVATGQVQMHVRSRQPLHDTMAAIRLKQPVQNCGYALQANAEHYLRSRLRLANIYPEPALQETLFLSQLCTFDLGEIRYQYPREIVPTGMTPGSYLRQETFAGAHKRYPKGLSVQLKSQLENELAVIAGLQYEPYFLTVYEIVQFARSRNILCQGRGSAANSAVCYCLGITEVDPENGNALFARFISQARKEPPDIDVDFEHQRREEVIQHVYEKYGRHRAALTAVVTTYRSRSVLRDTGKALGLDPDLIDKVAKSFHYWSGKQSLLEKIAEHGLDPHARITQMWAGLAQTMMGFPRHLSQHPGGFVIAHSALYRLVPIENAAMPDRSIVQWDKDDLDTMRLLKVDILALGMLSALQRCLKLVSQRRGKAFTMQDIRSDDAETYAMIQRADTVGVFQIESRAQMSMLPRLKPQVFYDLVVQVAIVRPGPIQGGMVHPYLRRRQGLENSDSPTPAIAKVLKRTLGVPIFQEQAMQIAMVAANFSADEADELRRSMAAWRRKGGVDAFRDRLINGMIANGCSEVFSHSIFKQLEGFGEYGFPESHAASFAQLAYLSAWLKCHEPEAFLAALLNSQPMGFYSSSQLVQDARRHQVCVLPVDIMASNWEACLEPQGSNQRPAVRLGLNQVKSLSKAAALRIEHARAQQIFSSVQDLAVRADLNRSAMDVLAAANALQALSGHRRLASWQAASQTFQGLLRNAPIIETLPPALSAPTEGQDIKSDYLSLGLTLGRHPLALLRPALQARQFIQATTLNAYPDRRLARACGIVTGRQRPQTAKGIIFVTLEDETGNVNVIVRAELAERQRAELLESELMGVYGIWQSHQGVCHLMASRLVNLSHLLGGLPTRSRNFH